jgi:hypothetical protein
MNRKTILLGVLALLGVAAAARYLFFGTGGNQMPQRYSVNGVCLACKQEVTAGDYGIFDKFPLKCAKCNAQAVYNWHYCQTCNLRFVPVLAKTADGSPPPPPNMPPCPKCGGGATGTWDPNFYEGLKQGDLPLPPWPPK